MNAVNVRWVWMAGLALGLGAVVACKPELLPEQEAPAGNPGWTGPPPTIQVYPENDPEKLRLTETAAMVTAHWEGAAPTDVQRVELINPRGRLYEVIETPLGPRGDAEVRMALAGTVVEEFRMHGTWTARFFINSGTAPVREVTFEVSP